MGRIEHRCRRRSTARRRADVAINDFHGALEGSAGLVIDPATGYTSTNAATNPNAVPAGGAEYLASHVRALGAQHRNTTVVSAGDLIGANPLLSALFHDEPTIEAMNLIGLDYNAVGTHEFDEGAAELIRMPNVGSSNAESATSDGDFHHEVTVRASRHVVGHLTNDRRCDLREENLTAAPFWRTSASSLVRWN